eukprot:TRINITY_DN2315_c0_g1_i1.p1 TRINITY_DN2315_c0_g1~~TRINITY_DN2315_c0_g1_i1.p1  ORF type:complete len:162 (-),score=14.73 TRINITY_DN2315_c0_g1_i1:406-891(-)
MDSQQQACEKMLDRIVESDATVKFMLKALDQAGCPMTRQNFGCYTCDGKMNGGFNPPSSVILCADQRQHESDMRDVIVHELVHAFDNCRLKLDWTNCRQHACTEIRAEALSGECGFWNEVRRGNIGLRAHVPKIRDNVSKRFSHRVSRIRHRLTEDRNKMK